MRDIDNLIFGDIAIADLPFSDGSKTKIRPILILSKDKNDYLIMKISSIIDKSEELDVIISIDKKNNLLEKSVFKIKKIGNFSKEILKTKIGQLAPEHCLLIKNNLKKFINQL